MEYTFRVGHDRASVLGLSECVVCAALKAMPEMKYSVFFEDMKYLDDSLLL